MIRFLLLLNGRRSSGNTIAEYTLIGSLLTIAAIGAFLIFGRDLNDLLAGLKTDFKYHSDQAAFMEAQAHANSIMAGMAGGVSAGDSSASYDPSMAQTTGANGDRMNTGLKGAAAAAKSTVPKTPEEQLKSLLAELANQAHKVAALQSMLESISKYSSGDTDKFKSTSIYYEGQVLNAWQLSWALQHGGEIVELEQKKNEVMASGVSDVIKETVASLTDAVKANAANTSNKTEEVLSSNIDPAAVEAVTDSKDTNEKAAKICEAAGKKDNGSKCEDD
ncbi:MAG: hypothetical protein K0Q50_2918 [Vampirovibrio sp.]|jgi:hypothetical protein|nr:hypothetical protein [Vampirovibrio sp.]